jgi:hypothetical protein
LPEEQLLRLCVQELCLRQQVSLKDLLDRLERGIICMVLTEANGSQREAARRLRIQPSTLNYKIQNMGLVPIRKYLMVEDLPASARPRQERDAGFHAAPARYRLKRERRQDRAAGPDAGTAGTRR